MNTITYISGTLCPTVTLCPAVTLCNSYIVSHGNIVSISSIVSHSIIVCMQVIAMALFFALIWKKPDVEEEDERPSHLKPNEEWMHKHMSEDDMKDPDKEKEIQRYQQGPMEIDHDILKAAREER